MFIELAEFLRCPEAHAQDTYCILVPDEMVGRTVMRGWVACPLCGAEYPIADGVLRVGTGAGMSSRPSALPDPQVVHALLGIESPGGYVVLVGSAACLVERFAELLGGVHFVAVNPPPGIGPLPILSAVYAPRVVPLKSAMARGVVTGSEHTREPWLGESARVLLRGLRLVVLSEDISVAGVRELAVGEGLWVGEKI